LIIKDFHFSKKRTKANQKQKKNGKWKKEKPPRRMGAVAGAGRFVCGCGCGVCEFVGAKVGKNI